MYLARVHEIQVPTSYVHNFLSLHNYLKKVLRVLYFKVFAYDTEIIVICSARQRNNRFTVTGSITLPRRSRRTQTSQGSKSVSLPCETDKHF